MDQLHHGPGRSLVGLPADSVELMGPVAGGKGKFRLLCHVIALLCPVKSPVGLPVSLACPGPAVKREAGIEGKAAGRQSTPGQGLPRPGVHFRAQPLQLSLQPVVSASASAACAQASAPHPQPLPLAAAVLAFPLALERQQQQRPQQRQRQQQQDPCSENMVLVLPVPCAGLARALFYAPADPLGLHSTKREPRGEITEKWEGPGRIRVSFKTVQVQ